MTNVRKEIKGKLRNRAGETIAETLVSVLIAAVALMMLAQMISATISMVKTSEEKVDAYYRANEALTTLTAVQGANVSSSAGSVSFTVSDDVTEGLNIPAQAVTVYQNLNYSDAKRTVCAYGKAG